MVSRVWVPNGSLTEDSLFVFPIQHQQVREQIQKMELGNKKNIARGETDPEKQYFHVEGSVHAAYTSFFRGHL